jgi:hypothetical protein
LPARSVVDTKWEVTRKVVIAIAWLTDTIVATDDDVGGQTISSTEITVEVIGRANELASGRVVDRTSGLRCGRGNRSCEEEGGVHHLDDLD